MPNLAWPYLRNAKFNRPTVMFGATRVWPREINHYLDNILLHNIEEYFQFDRFPSGMTQTLTKCFSS